MNTLTEAQKKALIDFTTDLTRRTMEMALALCVCPAAENVASGVNGAAAVPGPIAVAPRKRGRPRKHPLPAQG